jgi:hypothetical protein
MVDINKGDHYQNGCENEENKTLQRQAELHEKDQGKSRSQKLDQGVAPGNSRAAGATLRPQHQETYDRDIVIKPNRLMAVWTPRRGFHNRGLGRDPEDADIQEAADNRAENEGEKV